MSPRLKLPALLQLNTIWFGLSFMWNSLHVIILPAVLLAYVPETQKNTYLGLLTFAGMIIAMLVQPVSGALSDSWGSKWGRRRPLILIGTLCDFVFLLVLGWAGGIPWLALGYIGLQFTSNIAQGPTQALIPDHVPAEQMGIASGLKNLMDTGALVVASLVMGRLVPPDIRQASGPVAVVMVVLAISAAITLIFTREPPSARPTSAPLSIPDPRRLQRDLGQQPAFARLVLSRFIFLLGIYCVQAFMQYYVRDVLHAANPVKLTGDLMATIVVALIALSLTGGWLGDRIGHRRVQALASLVSAVGCFLLIWARTPLTLLLFGGVVGMGIGLFLTANWALANSLVPPGEAGKFMGLTNLATAGAGASARLAGPLVDFANNTWPGVWAGYTILFVTASLLTLASLFYLRQPPQVHPHSVDSLETFEV